MSSTPRTPSPDPLTRERLSHEAFAPEVAAAFVPRPALVVALDAHAVGEGPPLLVTGASGSGKSALLAAWSQAYAAARPDFQLHKAGDHGARSPRSTRQRSLPSAAPAASRWPRLHATSS